MKRRHRHWFHCSDLDHGDRWTARRMVPVFCGEDEPKVPRLCVSSSVAGCLAARTFFGDIHVYQTEKRRTGIRPVGVWDASICGERWIVPPCSMIHILTIPRAAYGDLFEGIMDYVKFWRCCSVEMRALQLEKTIRFLDDKYSDYPHFVREVDRGIVRLCYAHYWPDLTPKIRLDRVAA